MLQILVLIGVAYLLGSIPFGFITGCTRGIDLRQIGSGNIGTTNVYRALGIRAAILVFFLDTGKGFVGTRMLPRLLTVDLPIDYLRIICGAAVMIGSVASLFMRLRGGKGVATAVGVFLGLEPVATVICLGVWAGLVARFRYVSLGSLAAAIALPLLVYALNRDHLSGHPVFYLSLVIALLVVMRHRSNIQRLLHGTETKIGRVGRRE
jgi:glycerol-3-phosphate acyltransferase PlsY